MMYIDEKNQIEIRTEYLITKRIIDLFFGLLLFILSIPLILIFSILIRLESTGKAIYHQERVGLNGKIITIRKLRSMYEDAEKDGPKWAEKEDCRITKVGMFIRKTRIDELPQLYNVLIGEMSLIGPRPEREVFINEFTKEIPNFRDRLSVKPGLSGLAQITRGYESTPEEKYEMDMEYIKNFGIKQDFKIFLWTIRIVFTGEGAR